MGDANDPEVYVTAVTAVLSRYPSDIGARLSDPKDGIAGRFKWLPTVSEIRDECDRLQTADLAAVKRHSDLAEQWRLREECEQPIDRPKQTYEEFCAEMAVRGLPIRRKDKDAQVFSPAALAAKFGVTREQWEAFPPTNAKRWDHV